jgi:hypothetical protein
MPKFKEVIDKNQMELLKVDVHAGTMGAEETVVD